MKMSNLLSVQKKCLPPEERSIQNHLSIIIPLILEVLIMVPALVNPKVLFSSPFIFMFLLTLLFIFVQNQTKKKYLKHFSSEQLEQLERECVSAPDCEGLMVTSEALLYFMPAILALPIQELVWVYPVAVKHPKGLMMRKTYYVINAVTRDKKQYVLLRKNMEPARMERSVIFLNEQLKKSRPHLIVGYSEMLSNLSKNEFSRLVQKADYSGPYCQDKFLNGLSLGDKRIFCLKSRTWYPLLSLLKSDLGISNVSRTCRKCGALHP